MKPLIDVVARHTYADALVRIVREEGVAGLYRGFVPALLLTSHGMVQVRCDARGTAAEG